MKLTSQISLCKPGRPPLYCAQCSRQVTTEHFIIICKILKPFESVFRPLLFRWFECGPCHGAQAILGIFLQWPIVCRSVHNL